jgi:hypothetical protein
MLEHRGLKANYTFTSPPGLAVEAGYISMSRPRLGPPYEALEFAEDGTPAELTGSEPFSNFGETFARSRRKDCQGHIGRTGTS